MGNAEPSNAEQCNASADHWERFAVEAEAAAQWDRDRGIDHDGRAEGDAAGGEDRLEPGRGERGLALEPTGEDEEAAAALEMGGD